MTPPSRFESFSEQVRAWAGVADRIDIDARWDGGAQLANENGEWVLRIGAVEHARHLGGDDRSGPA
jgi:hypothetical protein